VPKKNRVPDRRRLISLQEAGDMLGVSSVTVRRMINDGTISGYRVRGAIRVDANELEPGGRAVKIIEPGTLQP
jgi:excisionase family DNA binding protein